MGTQIYIEDIFLLNTLLDFSLLLITKKLTKQTCKNSRLILASILGGIYAMFFSTLATSPLFLPITKILFSLFLNLISFHHKSIKSFFITWFVFQFASLSLAGIVQTIAGIFNIKLLFSSAVIAYFAILAIEKIYNKKNKLTQHLKTISIRLNEKQTSLIALHDTGNESHIPIAEFSSIKCILPSDLSDEITKENDYESLVRISQKHKLKLIPFSTIAGSSLLLGIDLDVDNVHQTVAIYKEKLSDEYNAII